MFRVNEHIPIKKVSMKHLALERVDDATFKGTSRLVVIGETNYAVKIYVLYLLLRDSNGFTGSLGYRSTSKH